MKRIVLTVILLSTLAVQTATARVAVYAQRLAAGMDDKSAKGLNGGIIYLALLPLGLMSTIGYMWWRHNKQTK